MYIANIRFAEYLTNMLILIAGNIISIHAILQLLNITPSLNSNFCITGPFFNPGPLGCYVAIAMSISLANILLIKTNYIQKLLSISAIFFGSLIIALSYSRTAWIALIISVIVILYHKYKKYCDRQNTHYIAITLILTIVMLSIPLICFKTESALGRLHIWHIETLAIASRPILGFGIGKCDFAYGVTQAHYFSKNDVSETVVQLAGSPVYTFNDYLGVGVQIGIIGILFVISIITLTYCKLIHNQSSMAFGVLTLSILAIGSYPLRIELFIITALAFIAYPNKETHLQHNNKYYIIAFICLALYILFFFHITQKQQDYKTIYSTAYELYEKKDYKRSINEFRKGASISSNPMFHIMIGKNYEAMGKHEEAEKEYILSYYMSPSRIYPLLCLMKLYNSMGLKDKAFCVGKKIQTMRINKNNGMMNRLYDESIDFMNKIYE